MKISKQVFKNMLPIKNGRKKKSILIVLHLKLIQIGQTSFGNNSRKINSIDDAIMRFIASVAMARLAIDSNIKGEERALLISGLQDEPNSVKPEYFTKDGFNQLIETFEVYEKVLNNKIILKLLFPFWRHKVQYSILSAVVYEDNIYSAQINSATYTQKVLFFAQTKYLNRVEIFNDSNFQDWMRVIRNIVSRGSIDKDGSRQDIIRSPQNV